MYWSLLTLPFFLSFLSYLVFLRNHSFSNETERQALLKKISFVQPATTVIVLICAGLSFLSLHHHFIYTVFIFAGLVFSLGGDLDIIDDTNLSAILKGMILFFFTYIIYSIGLTLVNGFHFQDFFTALLVAGFILLNLLLLNNAGKMLLPVAIYGAVQGVLLTRTISCFFGNQLSLTAVIMVNLGAFLFILGDIRLAISRFRTPTPQFKFWKIITYFSPVLYYVGQYLIALSTSYY